MGGPSTLSVLTGLKGGTARIWYQPSFLSEYPAVFQISRTVLLECVSLVGQLMHFDHLVMNKVWAVPYWVSVAWVSTMLPSRPLSSW